MSKKSVREHFEILSNEALRQANNETDMRMAQDTANKVKNVGRALAEGKMPTTEQTTVALNKARLSNTHNYDSNLSYTGQQVLEQMDKAFASTTKMISEKNKGDHLQHMVQHSKNTATGLKEGDLYSSSKKASTKHAERTKQLLKEGGSDIALVARLIVTSSQFRKLIGDFYQVFEQTANQVSENPDTKRDTNTASSTITATSNKNNQSEGNKDSFPKSTREIRDSVVVGPVKNKDSVTTLSNDLNLESNQSKVLDPNINTKSEFEINNDLRKSNTELRDEIIENSQLYESLSNNNILKQNNQYINNTSNPDNNETDINKNINQSNDNNNNHEFDNIEMDPNTAAEKTKSTLKNISAPVGKVVADTVKSNFTKSGEGDFSQIHNEAANATKDIGNNIKQRLQNIKLDPQIQDQLINRFKNLCYEVQENEDYKKAVMDLIDIATKLGSHTQNYSKNIGDIAKNQTGSKDGVTGITSHSKQIIENFAGGNSMDPLINSITILKNKTIKDPELKKFFSDAKEFIQESMLNSKYLEDEDYNRKAEQIIDQTRKHLTTTYKEDSESVMNETKKFNQALQEDPTTNQFVKDFETLGRTLFLDETGKPTIKRELIDDIRSIIPLISEKLKVIRLPRVEHEDENVHIILDNVVLELAEILPRSVYLRTDTEFDIDDDQMLNAVTMKIRNINGKAKKVAFYLNVKKGMIKPEEAGYVDVNIPNQGVTIDLTLAPPNIKFSRKEVHHTQTSNENKSSISKESKDEYQKQQETQSNEYIQVLRSNSRVHEVKINIYDTKHPQFVYKLFSGIINKIAKKKIEEGINDGVKQMFAQLNAAAANSISQRNSLENKTKNLSLSGRNKQSTVSTAQTSTSHNKNWKSDAFDI